ncbi:MAG TPA: ribonuclease R, partial [Halobacteriales archaeon]|nr:ribonuclease R [Halobacteriales archaeon]
MTDREAQAEAGTAEAQGPVEIDPELARHVENKREELLEKFELHDQLEPSVIEEAQARADGVEAEIQAEADEREDLR